MENPASQITNFSLEDHSFLFPNRFNLKSIIFAPRIPLYYGLCGGMCFAALDVFYDQKKVPDHQHPEDLPKNLLKYLIKRQLHSTGFRSLSKLGKWLFLPTTQLIHNSISNELPQVINFLSLGKPVPIILVRSNKLNNPTNNHQILIVGHTSENFITELQCYDPNYPGRFTYLTINRRSDNPEISQSTGEPIRGFFINDYKIKLPKILFEK